MKNWSDYAVLWRLQRDKIRIEDPRFAGADRAAYLRTLGDEWGTKDSVDQLAHDGVIVHVNQASEVLEIGAGGGRFVERIAPHCKSLVAYDVEPEMVRLCEDHCKEFPNVTCVLGDKDKVYLPFAACTFDLVYAFDTFVHLDQRTLFRYLIECARVLKLGGLLTLHVASHEKENGWLRFEESVRSGITQGKFGSFEYIDSASVRRMAARAGFAYCQDSLAYPPGNFYYDRDLVCMMRKEG
jgi:SAM-dependent methyltransferase